MQQIGCGFVPAKVMYLCPQTDSPVVLKRPLLLTHDICAGTELALAVEAAEKLEKDGKKARVVSFVSWELFEEQSQEYKVGLLSHLPNCTLSQHAC